MWIFLIAFAIAMLLILVHLQYTHWDRTNIPHEKAVIPFGSFKSLFRKERTFGLVIYDIYKRSQEKLVGIYLLYRPAILIRDAELVRQIMTADFASFHDRGLFVDEDYPLSANIFTMRGHSWKTLRSKLTPSFSSGKLKGMFETIDDVGDKMVQHLNSKLAGKDNDLVEIKTICTTYAIDIIGSVIFGLDIDSFTNPNNEFRRVSNNLFESTGILQKIYSLSTFAFPPIAFLMTRLGFREPIVSKLKDIMQRTIQYREENKVVRKDLLQLLIQLRNTGKISQDDDDKMWDIETAADGLKSMSYDMLAANAFLFYIAGSETTAATAAFTIYELAMYPDLLRKALAEIQRTFEKHGLKPTDKLTYDALMDMEFIELCIKETIRKYPGLPFLNRECTQDFKVPDTDYIIKKGTPILISLFGLHRDPEYFPEPMKYDPERFLEQNHRYNEIAYMPFGEGPRHCIAQRMGRMNSKVALVKLLSNFDIEPMPHKKLEFMFHTAPVLIPKDGLNVRMSRKKF